MKKYLTKEMRKRILLMLVGVILMGVGVQFLNRTCNLRSPRRIRGIYHRQTNGV